MMPGKAVALTILTFVRKEMDLLFNMLSRFVTAFLPRSKRLLILWLQSLSSVCNIHTHTHLQIHMYACTCLRFCFFDWTVTDVHSIWIPLVFDSQAFLYSFDPCPTSHSMSCRHLPLVVIHSVLHLFPVYVSTAAVPTDLQTWVHFEDVNNLWMQAVSKKHFPKCTRIDLYPHWTWQISALRRLAFSLHSLDVS